MIQLEIEKYMAELTKYWKRGFRDGMVSTLGGIIIGLLIMMLVKMFTVG